MSLPEFNLEPESWNRVANMAELGVMTASLVHELRQSLFAIKAIGQLGVANGGGVSGERLEELLRQVDNIEELVTHYSSMGRFDLPACVFDFNDAIRSAVNMLAHRSRRLGNVVEVSLAGEPLWVFGRESAMRQIGVNLLQNALDAVREVDHRQVIVRTYQDEEQVYLVVEDNGIGVSPKVRHRMFEPFVTTKPRGRGTGLGLHIARNFAAEAGGSIEALFPDNTQLVVRFPRSPAP